MRAAIFIDGGYVQSQFRYNKIDPDYEEFADYFLAPARENVSIDLLRCYYYYCAPYMSPEPTESELKRMETHSEFVDEIENLDRWSMRLGKLEKRWDGKKEYFEQKRVDVLLSVDFVRHAAAGHIQHAVLVAGDSDFVPAVEAAKEHGVTVSLWCGKYKTVHKDLISVCDEVHSFQWNEFPRINGPEKNSQRDHHQKQPKQRGQSKQGSSGRPQSNRNQNQRKRRHEKKAARKEAATDQDKESWASRFKKFWD
ncbi:MAG: NYN domain-containing protein [Pseudobacteriovorax sp.]|nr:NYN domain-containing protein [Pseudobacteriovorax sp.]